MGVYVGSVLQQHFRYRRRIITRRYVQRRIALVVLGVYVGSVLQQPLRHRRRILRRRVVQRRIGKLVQRRIALVVLGVYKESNIHYAPHQDSNHAQGCGKPLKSRLLWPLQWRPILLHYLQDESASVLHLP